MNLKISEIAHIRSRRRVNMNLEELQKLVDQIGNEKGEISDGSHSFNELYYHRMILFSVITRSFKSKCWKSWLHEDGTMFDDYFIVGICTPDGDYTYHYHKDYWDMFDVYELEKAPKWDGHEAKDIDRLLSLFRPDEEDWALKEIELACVNNETV